MSEVNEVGDVCLVSGEVFFFFFSVYLVSLLLYKMSPSRV